MEERGDRHRNSVIQEGVDRISNLPDPLITSILSLLPIDDAVRCGVLSIRWKDMWRYTSCLNLDQKSMIRKEIGSYVRSKVHNYNLRLRTGLRHSCTQVSGSNLNPITEAARYIDKVIDDHFEPLTQCRIKHMVESVRDASRWMRKLLLEKNVRELSMECDDPNIGYRTHAMDVPFVILSGYHVFEMKNYQLRISTQPSHEFPQNLKTLKLVNVMMEEGIEFFLSNCLYLENLTLNLCKMSTKLQIHSSSVKVLTLEKVVIPEIEVFAINLEVLLLYKVICRPKSLDIIAPNLRVLYCCRDYEPTGEIDIGMHLNKHMLKHLCSPVVSEIQFISIFFDNLIWGNGKEIFLGGGLNPDNPLMW